MTTIKLKNGSGAPTAGDLAQGEPALDLTNKRLYTEDSGGTVIEVGTNPGTDVTFADNRKAVFGAGSDLQIYHDTTASRIVDAGTGSLKIQAQDFAVNNPADTANMITAAVGGAVTAFHDGSVKLATTSTGIDVTGTVTADGLTVDGAWPLLTLNNTQNINTWADGDVVGELKFTTDDANMTNPIASIRAVHNRAGTGHSANDAGLEFYTSATTTGTIAKRMEIESATGDISFYEDTGTTAKLFWDASAESLGIGTTSPNATLKVQGPVDTATLSTSSTPAARINNGGAVSNWIGANGYNYGYIQSIQDDGTNNVKPLALQPLGGNVGIGTSSPTFGLSVEADNGSGYAALFRKSSSDPALTIQTTSSITQIQGLNSALSATNDIAMQLSGGNVGIGISSPSEKLHVAGALRIANNSADTYLGFGSNSDNYISTASGGATIFRELSTERMRIDSSGNVGIGNSSPSSFNYLSTSPHLVVGGGSSDAGVTYYSSTNGYGRLAFADGTDSTEQYRGLIQFYHGDNSMQFYTGSDERMRIDSSGNVSIGSGTAYSPLSILNGTDISMNTGAAGQFNITGNAYGFGIALDATGAHLYTNSAARPLIFGVNETERMRLDSSGRLIIGYTAADGIGGAPSDNNLTEIGKGYINLNRDDTASAVQIQFGKNGAVAGSIVTTSSTTYNTTSDRRAKESIADADDAGAIVDAIRVRKFDWKADGSHQRYGMIAQELLESAPEVVHQPENLDDMMGVDYSKLVPMMLKEIQSLRARVAQLEGEA